MRVALTGRNLALALAYLVLVGPAVLLTVLRLADPSSGRGVQAVAFTPFALVLYAAALVLTLLVMAVRRTLSPAYVVPAGLAATGMVLHAVWFAPMMVGETPAAAADAEHTVVMTANVLRGRGDGAELVERVREHGVEVLVVNEITGSSLAEMDAAGLGELLPERAGEPGPEDDVAGTMVFSTEPVRTVAHVATALDSLVVDTGGLRVLAVHPMSPVWPDHWREDHDAVLDAVRSLAPDLAVGDFNATLDHAPMRVLRDAGYRDAIELTNGGFAPTWPDNGGFGVLGTFGPVAQIDHVLVSGSFTVTAADSFDLTDADHHPVVAEVAPR